VTEHLHDHSGGDALGEQEARGGVPAVVEPVVRHACLLLDLGEVPGDLAAVQGRPGGCTEDQVVVLPGAGTAPLGELAVVVRGELLGTNPWQRDRAAAGP
jgi:hypothetical protein